MVEQTSIEAIPTQDEKVHDMEEIVWALNYYGPLTNEEVADILDMPLTSVRPRMSDLYHKFSKVKVVTQVIKVSRRTVYRGRIKHVNVWGLI